MKLGPNICSLSSNAWSANFALMLFDLLWKHAELEKSSAHQLGTIKAVEMLQSSTQLAKNHGDDLGLEYLWNGDE